ncbi:hypothetical protein D3C83_186180 [compost metagenome]
MKPEDHFAKHPNRLLVLEPEIRRDHRGARASRVEPVGVVVHAADIDLIRHVVDVQPQA